MLCSAAVCTSSAPRPCQAMYRRGRVGAFQETDALRLEFCRGSRAIGAGSTFPFQPEYAWVRRASVSALSKSPTTTTVALSGV